MSQPKRKAGRLAFLLDKQRVEGLEYVGNLGRKAAASINRLYKDLVSGILPSAIACEPPESPVHGNMDCSPSAGASAYNSSCTFTCAEGFELRGSDVIRCADMGQWTAPAPVCEGNVTLNHSTVPLRCDGHSTPPFACLLDIDREAEMGWTLCLLPEIKWWARQVLSHVRDSVVKARVALVHMFGED